MMEQLAFDSPSQKTGGRALIDWFNALVDYHLGEFKSLNQLKAFLIYLRHANSSGEAFPSMESVGRRMGIGTLPEDATEEQKDRIKRMRIRKARKYVAELSMMRFLERVDSSDGTNGTAKRRVLITASPVPEEGTPPPCRNRVKMRPREARAPVPEEGSAVLIENKRHIQRLNKRLTISAADAATCEEIYRAYPRPVAKQHAIKAIDKALKQLSKRPAPPEGWPAWLLMTVRRYADARRNEDPQFTPYPATWFNRERYFDDPKSWEPTGNGHKNGKRFDDGSIREGLMPPVARY